MYEIVHRPAGCVCVRSWIDPTRTLPHWSQISPPMSQDLHYFFPSGGQKAMDIRGYTALPYYS